MMFSHLPKHYSSKKPKTAEAGFSLIELIVSIAIIAITTTVILIDFTNFDSAVLVKSQAYEVATALRETQTYSVSVFGNNNDFDTPYGMSFSIGKNYHFFRDTEPIGPPRGNGTFDTSPVDETLLQFTIGRDIEIHDVCIVDTGGEQCASAEAADADEERIDITFRRPEFDALIKAINFTGVTAPITAAKIYMKAGLEDTCWVTQISHVGQITVNRVSSC